MYNFRDIEGHVNVRVTLDLKVTRQGHDVEIIFIEFLDLYNVKIDTKIKSASSILAEILKQHYRSYICQFVTSLNVTK